jgi:hypothetical protein
MQVEVVAMRVGDEDDIGLERAGNGGPRIAADVRDPVSKDRIGQHAHAIDLDQRRGVPDVGDRRAAQAARMRAF